jgi:hypothetical protein
VNNADKNAADANTPSRILRAKDILPPYSQNPPNTDNPDSFNPDFNIPKFDLAEQILSQQRRLSAEKRRSPNQKIGASSHQPDVGLINRSALPSAALSVQQDFIIVRDIVKRDIEKLCKGRRYHQQR